MQGLHPSYDLPLLLLLHAFQSRSCTDYLGPEFIWGALWNELSWLPQLRVGNTIVAREQWRFGPATPLPSRQLRSSLVQFLTDHRVPQWVSLTDGDNELLVDVRSEWGLAELEREYTKSRHLRLQEWIATDAVRDAQSPAKRFANEIVVPYVGLTMDSDPAPVRGDSLPYWASRRIVGSEWIYFKLYSGRGVQSEAIRLLAKRTRELVQDGRVDRWHFVRYFDRAAHVRFRARSTEPRAWAVLADEYIRCLSALEKEAGLTVEIATYEPEIARYGGAIAFDAAEEIFTASSAIVAASLEQSRGLDLALPKAVAEAVAHMHWLIDCLSDGAEVVSMTVGESLRRYKRMTGSRHASVIERATSAAYRGMRAAAATSDISSSLTSILALPVQRELLAQESRIAAASAAARQSMRDSRRTTELGWIIDVVHMHCNRLFEDPMPEQEYLAYLVLDRHLRAQKALASASANTTR